MLNLAEYRKKPQSLADFLPWAALVAEGVVLNKDGSLQRTAGSAVPTSTRQRRPNWSARRRGSTMRCAVLAPAGQPSSKRAAMQRSAIRTANSRMRSQRSSTPSARRNSRKRALTSRPPTT